VKTSDYLLLAFLLAFAFAMANLPRQIDSDLADTRDAVTERHREIGVF